MMAAMAQQDCGQCGYNCNDYSKAIADGDESRLNLCVPGEKATFRMLKALAEELGDAPPEASKDSAKVEVAPASTDAKAGYARSSPVDVVFEGRHKLNKTDSEKSTFHIDIDLTASGIEYVVGDSFGLFPMNDPELVEKVIAAIGAPRDFPFGDKSLVEMLTSEMSLGAAPDALFELISYITGGDRRAKAKLMAKGEDPDGDVHTLDVLAVLEKFDGLRPRPRSLHRVPRPIAAASLLDLVVA